VVDISQCDKDYDGIGGICHHASAKMNVSHTAAATVESPGLNAELHSSTNAGPSTQRSPKTDDLELMTLPSVIGREAGERDPLLLRSRLIPKQEINGLRQSVHPISFPHHH